MIESPLDAFMLADERGRDLMRCFGPIRSELEEFNDPVALESLAREMATGFSMQEPATFSGDELRELHSCFDPPNVPTIYALVYAKWKKHRAAQIAKVDPIARMPNPMDFFLVYVDTTVPLLVRMRPDVAAASLCMHKLGLAFATAIRRLHTKETFLAQCFDKSRSPLTKRESWWELLVLASDGCCVALKTIIDNVLLQWSSAVTRMAFVVDCKQALGGVLPDFVPSELPPTSFKGLHSFNEWAPKLLEHMDTVEAEEIAAPVLTGDSASKLTRPTDMTKEESKEYTKSRENKLRLAEEKHIETAPAQHHANCRTYVRDAIREMRTPSKQHTAIVPILAEAANYWSHVPYTLCSRVSLKWAFLHKWYAGCADVPRDVAHMHSLYLAKELSIGKQELRATQSDPILELVGRWTSGDTIQNADARFNHDKVPPVLRLEYQSILGKRPRPTYPQKGTCWSRFACRC